MLGLNKGKLGIGEPIYRFDNNHSVDFDGVDDFIQLGEPISYTQHTISAWVKIGASSDSRTIFDARDADNDGIRIYVPSNNKIIYQLNTSDISSLTLTMDEWVHVVATYDGTTQKLYINGSLANSTTTSQTIDTTTNAEIGARNFSTRENEFLGKIDELAIYDRALTAAEVTEIYRIKYGANLVQNGRFDELGSELVSNTNFTMGADLIQNGGLDELGSELVTNGDFSNGDTAWELDTGWSITNSQLRSDGTGNSGAEQTGVFNTSGKTFKITFDVNVDSGTLNSRVRFKGTGNTTISNITSAGSYTFYAVSVASQTALNFVTLSTNTAVYSIDNVSVKQVDPNDRWSLDTGWAYSNNGVTCSSGNGTFQTNGLTLSDSTFHKLTFDIVTYESGNLKVDLGNSETDATFTSAGSKTIFMNSGGFRRPRFYGGAFRGTISNIKVQKISGWSVSSQRGFAIDNNGHLEINSSLVEDTGSITYSSFSLANSPFVVGKTYKVVITDLNVTSGAFELKYGRTHDSTPSRPVITSADNGTYVEYFKAVNTADDITINNEGGTVATLSSISIKQVDPNNRWSAGAGGAAKQALTDVATLTVTGGFDIMLRQNGILTSGKKYKITYNTDLSGITSGSFKWQTFSDSSSARAILNGTNTVILTANGSDLYVSEGGASGTGIFTFIMVEEQKYVASNLKLNSGNYKSADPVIVSTKSVDFDADAYLDAGNVGAVKTLSFWFNPDSDITDSSSSTRLFGFNGTSYFGITLGAATGFLTGEVLTVLPNDGSRTGTTHTFEAGRWYHVAVVWNDTQEYYDIFINGVARTDLNTGTGVNSPFESFLIGTANDTSNFFNGQIDDVGIFNVSLNSDQVIEIYNQGVPSNLAASSAGLDGALTGYWKMGDGTLDEAPLIADQTNATLGSDVDLTTGSTTAPDSWQVISANSINYTNSNNALEFYETGFTVTTGKTYKITLTVSNYTGSGSLGWSSTGGVPNPEMRLTSNGTVSSAFVATGNVELRLFGRNTNTGTLTVSVNEVGGNPALMINTPTIVTDAPLTKIRNYYRMGDGILDFFMSQTGSSSGTLTDGVICDMIEPSLGSELVINGDFSIAVGEPNAGWEAGSGWTIDTANNRAVRDNQQTDNTQIYQNIAVEQDKIYKLEYTREYLSGTGQTNVFSDFVTDNSFTTRGRFVNTETGKQFTIVSYFQPQYTGNFLLQVYGIGTFSGIITNVSMKKVNGVAGLMTNMLNTNITNDVPS